MNTIMKLSETEQSFGVMRSTLAVVESARHVWIDERAVKSVCQTFLKKEPEARGPEPSLHWNDGSVRTSTVLLVLDAWNFSFWPDLGQEKWSIEYEGQELNGYQALAACVKRALDKGIKLYDPKTLTQLKKKDLKSIFRGTGEIPLLNQRLAHAHEVGRVLLDNWAGDFSNLVRAAEGSAVSLTEMIVENFSCFDDVGIYFGREVKFYKRAQLLVADLHASLCEEEIFQFHDLHQLTAFADYKIPQVLAALGVLRYSPELQSELERQAQLPKGDYKEVEIRAGMVWAIELLRRELEELGQKRSAAEIDWILWEMGQENLDNERPYHRTRTIFY